MLGPMVGICLGLTCNANWVSKMRHSVCSPQSRGELPLLQASSMLVLSQVLIFSCLVGMKFFISMITSVVAHLLICSLSLTFDPL